MQCRNWNLWSRLLDKIQDDKQILRHEGAKKVRSRTIKTSTAFIVGKTNISVCAVPFHC